MLTLQFKQKICSRLKMDSCQSFSVKMNEYPSLFKLKSCLADFLFVTSAFLEH